MDSYPEGGGDGAVWDWFVRIIRETGYDLDDEAEDDAVARFFSSHASSVIPARTTGGDPMPAWRWFRDKGASNVEYLEYLDRQKLRANHSMMLEIEHRELDEEHAKMHWDTLAESERWVTAVNLAHPEEVSEEAPRAGRDRINPSFN
jgi:hypothetical protein